MMRGCWISWGVVFLILSASALVVGQSSGEDPEGQVTRGEYLVREVARCVECHSPRNSRGEIDTRRLLKGAPIPVESPFWNDSWAFQAPAIAGLPGWSADDAVFLLMNGRRQSGWKPRAPMPSYRMNRQDAEAIVAYLRSLH